MRGLLMIAAGAGLLAAAGCSAAIGDEARDGAGPPAPAPTQAGPAAAPDADPRDEDAQGEAAAPAPKPLERRPDPEDGAKQGDEGRTDRTEAARTPEDRQIIGGDPAWTGDRTVIGLPAPALSETASEEAPARADGTVLGLLRAAAPGLVEVLTTDPKEAACRQCSESRDFRNCKAYSERVCVGETEHGKIGLFIAPR